MNPSIYVRAVAPEPRKLVMKRIRGTCVDCGIGITGFRAFRCHPCKVIHRKPPRTTKEYRREWQLKKKYDFEIGEFEAWWITFKGKCGICDIKLERSTATRGQSSVSVVVDHDHKTDRVRGLLCGNCNKGLGHFKDNSEILRKAIIWVSE